ncbi:methyltransferase domain-containing protein [Ornithinimicrobium sp. Y1694]|uniref:methyltransferase domain-containing protein n=1 Tax=Ornithinimicrobium sp. Y1694 TaxID=3418590 RepID=UPI003CF15A2A
MQLAEQFNRAAPRYDLLTRLNPGYHRALADAARGLVSRVRRAAPRAHAAVTTDPGAAVTTGAGGSTPPSLTLWDLGCGSGLSTQALVDAAGPDARIIGLDSSVGMLDQARAKDWPSGVSFVQAYAQDLPEVAAREGAGQADGAFAAYLLRNVPADQRDAVVAAIRDQVAPGGWIALQDYHVKGSPVAQAIWTVVCFGIVTPLAIALRGNPAIYAYLWRSVLDNDSIDELAARLTRAGLTDLTWSTARGWQRGILHTVLARRPETAPGQEGTA